METVVQKLDGSPVADGPKLEDGNEQIVQRVQKGETVCTVVSVMGGTTEKLMVLARLVTDFTPKHEVDPLLSSGELIHMALLSMVIQKQRLDVIRLLVHSQKSLLTIVDRTPILLKYVPFTYNTNWIRAM